MKVSKAIPNGLEYLNITSPNFKKSDLTKALLEKGSKFLVDAYASSVYLDKLSSPKLKGRIILTTMDLSLFTSANVRSRFDDVVRVIKHLDHPDLMIHNTPLYRNLNIDDKKIEKIAKSAVKMVEGVSEHIDKVVLVVSDTEHIDKLCVYFETIINSVGLKKIAFMITQNTTDTKINLIQTKFPTSFISV